MEETKTFNDEQNSDNLKLSLELDGKAIHQAVFEAIRGTLEDKAD
jgi:hypothetical protein